MIKRLLLLTTLGVMLSGCFMVPMAFVGPAVSGFSTASIAQSALTTGAGYIVKKNTGKSITEHAFDAIAQIQTPTSGGRCHGSTFDYKQLTISHTDWGTNFKEFKVKFLTLH